MPPIVPRASASVMDDEVLDVATTKGSTSVSDTLIKGAESRSKSVTAEPEARLKKRSARAG